MKAKNLITLFYALLIVTFEAHSSRSRNFPRLVSQVVSGLKADGETELTLLLDFDDPDQKMLLENLFERDIQFISYNIQSLQKVKSFSCPVFVPWPNMTEESSVVLVPENELYSRRQLFPISKWAWTILIWTSGSKLDKALEIIESTIAMCKQRVDLGVLHRNTKFLFVTEGLHDTKKIFKVGSIKKQPHVAALTKVSSNYSTAFYSYNFYHETNKLPELFFNYLWMHKTEWTDPDIFTSQKSLGGKNLKAVIIPYAHYIQADYLSDEEGGSPHQRYYKPWGLTVDILDAMKEKLDFTVSYYNPDPVRDYGNIGDNGMWTGAPGLIYRGICDVMLNFAINFEKSQIMEIVTYNVQEFETFVSPAPMPKPNYLAVLAPFSLRTWIFTISSLAIVTLLLIILARLEEKVLGKDIRPWALVGESLWHCFGILLGESTTLYINLYRIKALRWLIGTWMLSSMLLCFFYSSTLKSHLTSPVLIPSLKSFAEIVEGHLPWKIPPFISSEYAWLPTLNNSVIRKLWNERIVLDGFSTPLTDVQEGKAVRIDWLSDLKARIKVRHTTSDGKLMVHLGNEPLLYSRFMGGMFHPASPWGGRFAQYLSRISDSGLVHYWEERAWRRMRAMEMASLPHPETACNACPLKPDHYQGAFIFYSFTIVFSLVCFLGEKGLSRLKDGGTVHGPAHT